MPNRKPSDRFRIVLSDDGFSVYDGPTHRWSLLWKAVLWIAAYKQDLYSVDRVCMEFVTESGGKDTPFHVGEVHEELEGFSELVGRVRQVFPSSKQDWEQAIWMPAFKPKYTTIYSKTTCVLLVAAEARELQSMTNATKVDLGLRWSRLVLREKSPSLLVVQGPGDQNARSAIQRGFERFPVGAIVSVGYVGALDPALEVGQIFLARRVKRMREKVDYQIDLPAFPNTEGVAQGTLLTIDRVAQTSQEKRMLRQSGADAVDMEAYAVAEEAKRRRVPFYCVRVVSDHANTDFPVDFNRARRPDGTFAGWKILAQAGLSSSRWQRLLDLKRDADLASERLAEFLKTCNFQ